MSDVVQNGLEWRQHLPSDQWVEVQRRRYKNRFTGIIGKGESNNKFKAADTKIQLFISNVHKDTTEQDIQEYIKHKTQDIVTLEKIHMKIDKGHNAFKVLVSQRKLSMFLNDALWPEGISFRKFITFRHKTRIDTEGRSYHRL